MFEICYVLPVSPAEVFTLVCTCVPLNLQQLPRWMLLDAGWHLCAPNLLGRRAS